MEIPRGSSLAVIGPNGSGKSTLLGVLAGTIKASSGVATVADRMPALVLQSTDVDRSLPITVRETVSLARYSTLGLFRPFTPADREAIDGAMKRLAIKDLAGRQFHELSGGQRQRVAVARALVNHPSIVFADEPTGNLDSSTGKEIMILLNDLNLSGATIILVTHDADVAAYGHRMIHLKDGIIIRDEAIPQQRSRAIDTNTQKPLP